MGISCSTCTSQNEANQEVRIRTEDAPYYQRKQVSPKNNTNEDVPYIQNSKSIKKGFFGSGSENTSKTLGNYNDYSSPSSTKNTYYSGQTLESEAFMKKNKAPYRFRSGAIYEGDWKGMLRDGWGVQTWPDGARYEGTFFSKMFEGSQISKVNGGIIKHMEKENFGMLMVIFMKDIGRMINRMDMEFIHM